jgi:hypothetical protein
MELILRLTQKYIGIEVVILVLVDWQFPHSLKRSCPHTRKFLASFSFHKRKAPAFHSNRKIGA